MFTKEKIERWIDALEEHIGMDERALKQYKEKKPIYNGISERKENLEELKKTLEQMYATITSDVM